MKVLLGLDHTGIHPEQSTPTHTLVVMLWICALAGAGGAQHGAQYANHGGATTAGTAGTLLCHTVYGTGLLVILQLQSALAILFAVVGHHMTRWWWMVVNAVGAGWIIVIRRTLGTDGMQFFLCNHAHVVPITVQLARTIVVVIGVAVAVAVCGFFA